MNDTTELPLFPANAPEVFGDPTRTIALIEPVLEQLADIINVPIDSLTGSTPCQNYTVVELRNHVLAWLQFFAGATNDPDGAEERIDTDTWTLDQGADAAAIVNASSSRLLDAITAGVSNQVVVMSQARMRGDAVFAMVLGEYIVHGWDLAVATARPWDVAADAAAEAHRFLEGVVAPEYRGEESGFFGDEVAVADDASALDRLLGFAGRNPAWAQPF